MTTRSDTEGRREALRPLFAEYEAADLARRVGKGDKPSLLSQFIAAGRAIDAALATPPDTDPSGLGDATGWRTGASWESNPAFVQALDDYNEVEHQDAAERHFWVERYDAIIEAAIQESRAGGGLTDAETAWEDQLSGEHAPHRGNHEDYACGFSGPHCWECGEPWPCRTERGVTIGPAIQESRAGGGLTDAETAWEALRICEEGHFA